MGVSQSLLAEIVARILTVTQPDHIILFGSAASGHMTADSDIDLLIVEPTPGNTHDEALRVRDAIGNIDYPVDVLIMTTERFEATRNVIGGIAYPATKYGRVLYAAA
jgi:predicted nucleotidyltransferase